MVSLSSSSSSHRMRDTTGRSCHPSIPATVWMTSTTHMLYVGAAKDARLTIARVDAAGKLSLIAQVPTHEGARNGVVTKDGTVYLAHSQRGQLAGLIVVSPSKK